MSSVPGDVLADLRRRAGLTQSQLALAAGTSQSAISAYERGEKDPGWATLCRLSAVLGYDLGIVPTYATRRGAAAGRYDVIADVLALSDALPPRPRKPMAFPPFKSVIRRQ